MIRVLGTKRIMVLSALVAINCALAAFVYMYVQPELQTSERTLRSLKSKESQTRSDITNMQMEFDQLEDQQAEFDTLKNDGFFSNQSRRDAQEVFLKAEKESGVLEAAVSVKPGEIVEDEEASKADYVLLESEVNIILKGVDDRDVYVYLDKLQDNFPGHLSVEKVNMRRLANVSETILRAIAGGQKPPLVEARVGLLWRTMVKRSDVVDVQNQTNNAQGGF